MRNRLFNSDPSVYGIAIFVILAISSVLSTLMMWHYSVDRGAWPLVLFIYLVIDIVYASLLVRLVRVSGYQNDVFAVGFNAVLALALVLDTYLYFAIPIDWLAVNAGVKKLTLFQKLVHSNETPWALYSIFFVGMVIVSEWNKNAGDGKS